MEVMAKVCKPTNPENIKRFPKFGHLALQGICNIRDLGGLPAANGRHIKRRRLLRSGALHDATAADMKQLIYMHDVEYVIDFRTKLEIDRDPDPRPLMLGVEYAHLPVLPESAIITIGRMSLGRDTRIAWKFAVRPYETIQELYLKSLLGEMGINAYKRLLDDLLKAERGATLWHCTQGKDRTGIAAILVEYALGVPMEYIQADYLATNLFITGWMGRMKRFLSEKNLAKRLDRNIEAYAYANRCYFFAAVDAMNGVFGSIDNYMEKALDFGPDKCAKLREMYLE